MFHVLEDFLFILHLSVLRFVRMFMVCSIWCPVIFLPPAVRRHLHLLLSASHCSAFYLGNGGVGGGRERPTVRLTLVAVMAEAAV